MNPTRFLQPADLHGLAQLAGDGVAGTSRLVEQLHLTISRAAAPLGRGVEGSTRGVTGLVYRSIRGVNALVGGSVNAIASRAIADGAGDATSAARDHWLAAVNGVVGDHLFATGNRLAIPMRFRRRGRTLPIERQGLEAAFEAPRPRLLVTVHGLCMNDLHWGGATGIPERLARSLDYSALDVHYNTGRAIADNGRELSDRLKALVNEWPVAVEDLVIVGHSMGGLVARSALAGAAAAGHAWPESLSSLVFLGTPHHGAPMERWGHRLDSLFGLSPYSAPFRRIGGLRSTGITDLRHGAGGPRPAGEKSEWFALAATARGRAGQLAGGWLGDGLVPVDSALGRHAESERDLAIPEDNCRVIAGAGHLGLIHHPETLRQLRRWLS